jgi:NTE family protein
MTIQTHGGSTRALVLGGGGVTGIAWEVGVLTGLLEAGVALREADTVIGTSAGSFVGVALASGYDMKKLFAAQREMSDSEIPTTASEQTMTAWYKAFETGGSDPQRVGAAFGKIAKDNPEPVPVELRRSVVEARLVASDWPENLKVTAIDADTGELTVFDRSSDISLVDAVSASGAVPGVWPLMYIKGRAWIDGGMVSAANARLAQGYSRIVILAPISTGYGLIPGAAKDAEMMRAAASVVLVTPDDQSIEAIGANIYDPTRRNVAAIAGRAQGIGVAGTIRAMW